MTSVFSGLVGAAFFASGVSALVYQVAWQRVLALQSGVGIYSIAMIVGAFMAGLGLGSWAGGMLSTRLDERSALRAFVGLELGVAAFGVVSVPLYYDGLSHAASLYDSPFATALLHFLSLLVPTALMGMSLPFLARASVSARETAGTTVGLLYGVNVLGAAVGALVTPWVLVRFFGIRGAVGVAVLGNLLAAGLSLVALRRRSRAGVGGASPETALTELVPPSALPALATTPPDPALPDAAAHSDRHSFALWMALYAASGFCALSLEILWFRLMDVAAKSIAFTFGTVLFIYLLGNAVGTLVGVRQGRRLRRPLSAFLTCQCLLLAYSALAVILLVRLPPDLPGLAWFYEYWGGINVVRLRAFTRAASDAARLYLVLPLLLFGPPTVLMGLSFPILQRAVHDDVRSTGRKVGFLQAANIAGCLLGSLLVGLAFLSWLGTAGTLRLLVLVGLGFALVGLREEGLRWRFGALGALLLALGAFVPSQGQLWLRLHGLRDEPRALIEEDSTGVASITPWGPRPLWRVWVNGKSNSILPFGGVHTALGAIPALMHEAPRDIAIIGLGSGDTAWAAGCRRDATESVVVYEIIAPQRRLLERLAAIPDPPSKLGRFLEDPRMTHVVADGRNAIDRGTRLYDVIEMDALFPGSAGAGNLYSVDFFARCARKLRKGGLMCSWGPTPRVEASFRAAFPHVVEMKRGGILVGSRDPIPIDLERWRARALSAEVKAYLSESRAVDVFQQYMRTARPAVATETTDLNRDLFPRDEFNTR